MGRGAQAVSAPLYGGRWKDKGGRLAPSTDGDHDGDARDRTQRALAARRGSFSHRL